jgi:mannose-6-phosphate isomerase
MRPRYVAKLWGGARIGELPAKKRPGHAPPARTGESWEVADLPEGSSFIDGGQNDGRPLRAVVAEHGTAVAGQRATRADISRPDRVLRFPLLVKLVDAGDKLSVQVHPGRDYARTHPGTFAKDESWLVVHADAGATVLHGMNDGVTREDFVRALAEERPEELMRAVPVAVGDVLRIPPGTMHAVGAGCMLLEVQEPSDTTFRVWDYRRSDAGKLRELHVEQALEVARFGPETAPVVVGPVSAGVQTAYYGMTIVDLSAHQDVVVDRAPGEPAVLFVLDGDLHVEGLSLPRGASAIVVASAGTVSMSGAARVVVMTTGT